MRGVVVRAFPLALFAALSEWVGIDLVLGFAVALLTVVAWLSLAPTRLPRKGA